MSLQTLSLAIASPGERTVRRPSREYCHSSCPAIVLFHMESSVKIYLILSSTHGLLTVDSAFSH